MSGFSQTAECGSLQNKSSLYVKKTNNFAVLQVSIGKVVKKGRQLVKIHAFVCLYYKEGTFTSETENSVVHCRCFECDPNAKNVYLCCVSCLCFSGFVTAGVTVALQCNLTACVQVPALPNTKAFSPPQTWHMSRQHGDPPHESV